MTPTNFPAFPVCKNGHNEVNEGLSARDWFAGHAPVHDLSQMIPQSLGELCEVIGVPINEYKSEVHYLPFIVALRYRWADQMLAERQKAISPQS